MYKVRTSIDSHIGARNLAKQLVESHAAVSVHIRQIESIYAWDGKIEDGTEYEVEALCSDPADVEDVIRIQHPYILPEVIFTKLVCTDELEYWCDSWTGVKEKTYPPLQKNEETKQLIRRFMEHTYTEAEIREMNIIIHIIEQEIGPGVLSYGYPFFEDGVDEKGEVRYGAAGVGYASLIAIQEEEYGFSYYLVNLEENHRFTLFDFQKECLPDFQKHCQKEFHDLAIPMDCLIYYLLRIKFHHLLKNPGITYVLHERYCLRATEEESGRYKLEPLHSYGCGMADDEVMQYGCHNKKPVFIYQTCPHCSHQWMFDDSKIPEGEKYELVCPMCETTLLRKKQAIVDFLE